MKHFIPIHRVMSLCHVACSDVPTSSYVYDTAVGGKCADHNGTRAQLTVVSSRPYSKQVRSLEPRGLRLALVTATTAVPCGTTRRDKYASCSSTEVAGIH